MKDHALVCCRFAWDCSNAMERLSKELASTFGPDTADLSMRFGIHRYVVCLHFSMLTEIIFLNSGPVTAGKYAVV